MDFYFATYIKRQCSRHGWKDIRRNQKIIVLADNMEEAVQKIDSCLKRRNDEIYNYVLRSKVIKCDAIDVQEMEDEMFEIFPIMKVENEENE